MKYRWLSANFCEIPYPYVLSLDTPTSVSSRHPAFPFGLQLSTQHHSCSRCLQRPAALLHLALLHSSSWCASGSVCETVQRAGTGNWWSQKMNRYGNFLAVMSVSLTEMLPVKAKLKRASFKSLTSFLALEFSFFKIHHTLKVGILEMGSLTFHFLSWRLQSSHLCWAQDEGGSSLRGRATEAEHPGLKFQKSEHSCRSLGSAGVHCYHSWQGAAHSWSSRLFQKFSSSHTWLQKLI